MDGASKCGSEGRGFKGGLFFFNPDRLLPRAWRALWARWEDWDHTVKLHPLCNCFLDGGVSTFIEQTPQFPGLLNTGITMTVRVVYGPANLNWFLNMFVCQSYYYYS